ncbi:MAG: DUF559 domain-containing protein [Acidimicrobiales bacterium]|nr:DUF559 domain-containing protein [Acidimicrobiales bacterium]
MAAGRLTAVSARVLRVAGAAPSEASQLMAAVLDVDDHACVSHASAAGLWGFTGFRALPPTITGIRRTGRSAATLPHELHRPRRLLPHHVVELDGLRITTPTRTLFDLAALPTVWPKRVELLLDSAWSRGLVSHASLTRMLGEIGRRGRAGTVLMRELLAARPPDHRPPESNLESRFDELARRAGFTGFERQVDVGGEDGWIGRVDFLDPRRRIVVEVDSERFHSSLTDRHRDDSRHAALRDAGYLVESFTDHDLFHDADGVIDRLHALHRAATLRSG